MFGPETSRKRRSDLKRCCALFTSFASRAVHIEVTNALDTDSFIQALRRFIARRGPVRSIRSNNGTNFVGPTNELRKALDEMNHEQVKYYLQKYGSDWITWENNPPAASHMGGIWECQIQTRPLTVDTLSDVNSHVPLSHSNLLT